MSGTESSTTSGPATATTAPPVSATAGLAPGAFVETRDQARWLTVPAEPTVKQFTGDCASVADAGWEASCERVRTALGDAVWVHERNGVQERVLVYVNRGGGGWELALRAADDDGTEFDATVQITDLTGEGNPKILVKLREVDADTTDGIDPPLQADVIEPSGQIVVHLFLDAGRSGKADAAAIAGQGLEVRDCEVDCVPTGPIRVRLIGYRDGAWRIVAERLEGT